MIAAGQASAQVCGDLLYYVTQVQVERDEQVALFGSMERSTGTPNWDGQTSQTLSDPDNTPMFEPGLSSYNLPDTGVDDAHTVTC